MPLGCGAAWLKLQAADHVEDRLLAEHDLEERVLVQQEDVAEDLIQVVEPLHILQVLREHVRLVDCQRVMKWDRGSIVGRHLAEISVSNIQHTLSTYYPTDKGRTGQKTQTSQTVKMLRSFLM